MGSNDEGGLSTLEYHLLLAVAGAPLHGYAIRDAIEHESRGALRPRAGTLYRVIARLAHADLMAETGAPDDASPHPGRARRYYELTPRGRTALADETERLKLATALAVRRLGVGRP